MYLTNFFNIHFSQSINRKSLAFNFVQNLWWQNAKLPHGTLPPPKSLLDELADRENPVGHQRPSVVHRDLEQRPWNSRSVLNDVSLIGVEREALDGVPRDVRLEEHVDFSVRIFDSRGHLHTAIVQVVDQLVVFFFSHLFANIEFNNCHRWCYQWSLYIIIYIIPNIYFIVYIYIYMINELYI